MRGSATRSASGQISVLWSMLQNPAPRPPSPPEQGSQPSAEPNKCDKPKRNRDQSRDHRDPNICPPPPIPRPKKTRSIWSVLNHLASIKFPPMTRNQPRTCVGLDMNDSSTGIFNRGDPKIADVVSIELGCVVDRTHRQPRQEERHNQPRPKPH